MRQNPTIRRFVGASKSCKTQFYTMAVKRKVLVLLMTTKPPRWKHRHYRHRMRDKARQTDGNWIPKPTKNRNRKKVWIFAFFITPLKGHGFRYEKRRFLFRGLSGWGQEKLLQIRHKPLFRQPRQSKRLSQLSYENVYETIYKN